MPLRRSRGQRLRPSLLLLAVLGAGALLLFAVVAAYEAGRSELRLQYERALAEAQRVKELDRLLNERIARLEAEREALQSRYAELERTYRQQALEPRYATLLRLLRRKEAEGVPLERLAFLLESASVKRDCSKEVETHRLFVRVPLARQARDTVAVAEGRITVTVVGRPARDAEGRPQAWFDPAAPVEVTFHLLDGRREQSSGVLPLMRELVLDDVAYRVALHPARRRGFLQVTVQRCAYP